MADEDIPRGTTFENPLMDFPELEDFLAKSPEDSKYMTRRSPKANQQAQDQQSGRPGINSGYRDAPPDGARADNEGEPGQRHGLSKPDPEKQWRDEDANRSQEIIMSLDRDRDESMEFQEDEDEQQQTHAEDNQLTVNLANLIGSNQKQGSQSKAVSGSNRQKQITNHIDERPTLKGHEYNFLRGPGGRRSTNRKSQKPQDIGKPPRPDGGALFDFFKSLDYRPDTANQGTVRASYKSGRGSYSLFGVPGQKPGDKGQVYVQSQLGFDKDLPPVRLSGDQRDSLIHNFQELGCLASQDDESEGEALDGHSPSESPSKGDKNVPLAGIKHKSAPLGSAGRTDQALPRDRRHREAGDLPRHSEASRPTMTEESMQLPQASKAAAQRQRRARDNEQQLPPYKQRDQQANERSQKEKRQKFQSQYDQYMSGVGADGQEQMVLVEGYEQEEGEHPGRTPLDASGKQSKDDPTGKHGVSLMNIMYNGMSSVFGGFGGFKHQNGGPYNPNSTPNPDHIERSEENQIDDKPEQSAASPRAGQSGRPKHGRFNRTRPDHGPQLQPKNLGSPSQPFEENQLDDPLPKQFQQQINRDERGPNSSNYEPEEHSSRSSKSYKSHSLRSQQLNQDSQRPKKEPIVLKLTTQDFENKGRPGAAPEHRQRDNVQNAYDPAQQKFQEEPDFPPKEARGSHKKADGYKYNDPFANQALTQGQPLPETHGKQNQESSLGHSQQNNVIDEADLWLPKVILLVADNVKLIRNNSVPMLQVQVEIIQNAMSFDNGMCMLGLNDVIYIVPEFPPSEHDTIYSRMCSGSEYEEFQPFFDHYRKYGWNPDPNREDANIPERMVGLNKNCMTAIERDHYEPDLRGRAFINLKNIPNGHYTLHYLRIGQPISINSRLKVLGKAKNVFVNINRDKISQCKKPQLDLNHSSSRISKRETSKFKIMKAKQTKKRDNKILSLNSDAESDSSNEGPAENKAAQDSKKTSQQSQNANSGKSDGSQTGTDRQVDTQADSKDGPGLEMEFEDNGGPGESSTTKGNKTESSASKLKVVPPPLQDSKEYYNSTQRMTEAMIQNPQFQIFPIEEEDSMRTSMRESTREGEPRLTVESLDSINEQVQHQQRRTTQPEHHDYDPTLGAIEPSQWKGKQKTPAEDAFEDAYRNLRLSNFDQTPPGVTDQPNADAVRPSRDEISMQIEDYQRESLANLANLVRQKKQREQMSLNAPPEANDGGAQFREMRQRRDSASRRDRDHSRGSARSNQSRGSQRSRQSRGSARVKTIDLRDLESEPEPGRSGLSPTAPRPRSASSGSGPGPAGRPQSGRRGGSRGVSSEPNDDQFAHEMRDTTKVGFASPNDRQRAIDEPTGFRRQAPPDQRVPSRGRQRRGAAGHPINQDHTQMPQSENQVMDILKHNVQRSKSPQVGRGPGLMAYGRPLSGQGSDTQGSHGPRGGDGDDSMRVNGPLAPQNFRSPGSRPQSRPHPNPGGTPGGLADQPRPMDLLKHDGQQPQQLNYDQYGNSLNPNEDSQYPGRGDQAQQLAVDESRQPPPRRPGSAASLSRGRERNRFFSPNPPMNSNLITSTSPKRSVSPMGGPSGRIEYAPPDGKEASRERPRRQSNSFFTPSQIFSDDQPARPGYQQAAGQHPPPYIQSQQGPQPQQPRPGGFVAQHAQPYPPPLNGPNRGRGSSAGENFSEQSHSPVRPMGLGQMHQAGPFRQQTMKRRQGEVTQAGPAAGGRDQRRPRF